MFDGVSMILIVFLANFYNVPIPILAVGGAILALFLVALTVAPVPSSSVVTLAPALDAVGIPISGLAVLLGVDRIPDMFRTVVNAHGQIVATVQIERWTRSKASKQ